MLDRDKVKLLYCLAEVALNILIISSTDDTQIQFYAIVIVKEGPRK